jgi:Na+/melibiose symporter-like transporter
VPTTSQVLSAGADARYANLIFSLKQTGAPLGGLLAGFLIPPMIIGLSLSTAVVTLVGVSLVVCFLLAFVAPFADRGVPQSKTRPRFFEPILAVLRVPTLRRMVAASFTYSGMQLCLGAFLPVYLVEREGLSLSAAGWVFGVSQIGTMVGRLLYGWIADRMLSPLVVVVALGFAVHAKFAARPDGAGRLSLRRNGDGLERRALRRSRAPGADRPIRVDDQRRSEHQFHRRACRTAVVLSHEGAYRQL